MRPAHDHKADRVLQQRVRGCECEHGADEGVMATPTNMGARLLDVGPPASSQRDIAAHRDARSSARVMGMIERRMVSLGAFTETARRS